MDVIFILIILEYNPQSFTRNQTLKIGYHQNKSTCSRIGKSPQPCAPTPRASMIIALQVQAKGDGKCLLPKGNETHPTLEGSVQHECPLNVRGTLLLLPTLCSCGPPTGTHFAPWNI